MTDTSLTYFLAGALVGLMSSVLGIGGGIIIVPTLTVFFSFSQKEAIATSLLTIAMVSGVNVIRFQLSRLVDWQIVLLIALFSSAASVSAAWLALRVPNRFLLLIFIGFLIFLSWKTFRIQSDRLSEQKNERRTLKSLRIGLVTGLISGFAGVGGGAITTPWMLTSRLADNRHVVPASNGIMMFTAAFGALLFALAGTPSEVVRNAHSFLHPDASFLIFLGALPFALGGSHFQHRLPLRLRRNILGVLLVLIILRLIIKFITEA